MKPLHKIDEKALLLLLREGDKIAFSTIYLQHHAPLCLFAGKLLADEDEGQDIVDDVFLKLWEKKRRFNDSEHLKAFLYHRSEEHTSEIQSLMRSSYAVFCLKNKTI